MLTGCDRSEWVGISLSEAKGKGDGVKNSWRGEQKGVKYLECK